MKLARNTKNLLHPKTLLATVRGGDFAHPGSEKAIEIMMQHINKNINQRLLDVGCGMGGTAKYINDHGWGMPIGIDIDEIAVEYARRSYDPLVFVKKNVTDLDITWSGAPFDVIYLFSSFYAFSNQPLALQKMHTVAKLGTKLALFDYMLPKNAKVLYSPFAPSNSQFARTGFYPILECKIEKLLAQNGWQISKFINIHHEYITWYDGFVQQLYQQKKRLIKQFGDNLYQWAVDSYSCLLNHLKAARISGCIIIADYMCDSKNDCLR